MCASRSDCFICSGSFYLCDVSQTVSLISGLLVGNYEIHLLLQIKEQVDSAWAGAYPTWGKVLAVLWQLGGQTGVCSFRWIWPSLVYKYYLSSPLKIHPTVLIRHMFTVSDFQILIKSCSIQSRNDPSPKSGVVHETKFSLKISYSTHICLAQLDRHQTYKPVMVSVTLY